MEKITQKHPRCNNTVEQVEQTGRWRICILQRSIALIDAAITNQLNAIIHHSRFQRLEASWRGLHYLVEQVSSAEVAAKTLKIRVLDLSWQSLSKDLLRAIEFDQSELFRKIYSQEFDNPGGEPFGLLLGDYQVGHKTHESSTASDLSVLELMSKVAAASFAPFIASAAPGMFNLDDFADLEPSIDLERIFQQQEYAKWKEFRQSEDARFVGLVMPQVLMRLPYERHARAGGFCFKEESYARKDYLWGSAAYCFAEVVMRAFLQGGWFTDICGAPKDKMQGGVVGDLARHCFGADKAAAKDAVNVRISDKQEKILSELGFIPLCECNHAALNVFYSARSVQQAKLYGKEIAASNAEISTMLHYLLCVSRFAHYIKIFVRDKIGSFASPEDCELYLERWILQYTANGEDLTPEFKAKYPLREAVIKVQEEPGKPGKYLCFMYLRPHYQLEQIEAKLGLVTELKVE